MCRHESAAVHCNSGAMYEVSEEYTAFFYKTEDKTSVLKIDAVCVL
jgi:hypothetical protein